MPLGERPARACADKVFAISLPVGNWIVFYSFDIDHEIRLRMTGRFAPEATLSSVSF
jgi:hypothetical protein